MDVNTLLPPEPPLPHTNPTLAIFTREIQLQGALLVLENLTANAHMQSDDFVALIIQARETLRDHFKKVPG